MNPQPRALDRAGRLWIETTWGQVPPGVHVQGPGDRVWYVARRQRDERGTLWLRTVAVDGGQVHDGTPPESGLVIVLDSPSMSGAVATVADVLGGTVEGTREGRRDPWRLLGVPGALAGMRTHAAMFHALSFADVKTYRAAATAHAQLHSEGFSGAGYVSHVHVEES